MRRKEREVTCTEEILEILEACKVCRLGLCEEGKVYIVPMNYGYIFRDGRISLYFHCAKEGRKLDVIGKNNNVGIEMDCRHELVEGKFACQYSYYFASIIGNGTAEVVEEPGEKQRALGLIMKHQAGRDFEEFETNPNLEKAVAILRVDVEEYTCKQHKRDSHTL